MIIPKSQELVKNQRVLPTETGWVSSFIFKQTQIKSPLLGGSTGQQLVTPATSFACEPLLVRCDFVLWPYGKNSLGLSETCWNPQSKLRWTFLNQIAESGGYTEFIFRYPIVFPDPSDRNCVGTIGCNWMADLWMCVTHLVWEARAWETRPGLGQNSRLKGPFLGRTKWTCQWLVFRVPWGAPCLTQSLVWRWPATRYRLI